MVSSTERQRPIGLFDSGIGGLSVLHEVRRCLPSRDLIYVADSLYAPYGSRSNTLILQRSLAITEALVARGIEALVIACNTATAAAASELRARFKIPIVAMEPGIKPAIRYSRTGRIGVLATEGTLRSQRFAQLVETYAHGVHVITQPCPGLVEAIEAGSETRIDPLVRGYTHRLREHGVDVVVLGCTHFPLIRPTIERFLGPEVVVLDTGAAVARRLSAILRVMPQPAITTSPGLELWATGCMASLKQAVSQLGYRDSQIINTLFELDTSV